MTTASQLADSEGDGRRRQRHGRCGGQGMGLGRKPAGRAARSAAGGGSSCAAAKGRNSIRRLGNCQLEVGKTKTRPRRLLGARVQRRMDNAAAMVKLGKNRGQMVRLGDNLARQGGGADGQGKMERRHA
jgi:hypothetical protein